MEYIANHIELTGCLASAPQFSHDNHGRRFFSFYLEVARLSGTVDRLPVLAPEPLLQSVEASEGASLRVEGQIRSFNSRTPAGRRLIISVLAETLRVCDAPHDNEVTLTGVICKEPVYRRTPLGREICDVMLAVPRMYRRTDYIPCILWGRAAQEAAKLLPGAKLRLSGRLQSRDYIKVLDGVSQTRTAYELSVTAAEFPEDAEFSEEF